jgi:hypothetical protein
MDFSQPGLDEPAPFEYELKYRCRGNEVKIEAKSKKPRDSRSGGLGGGIHRITKTEFMKVDEEERPPLPPGVRLRLLLGAE